MSLASATGGNFKCAHGLDTDDVNEINNHCDDPANGHTLEGSTQCIGGCGRTINFKGIPYRHMTPEGFGIKLRCEECMQKFMNENSSMISSESVPEIPDKIDNKKKLVVGGDIR